MSLSQLSDQGAVLRAMAECDTLGREDFLAKYGFGEARTYFLEYDGRRYDSKAIAGVAYGFEHGRPLMSYEFSGGDRTVAAKLAELGFIVTKPDQHWDVPIGAIRTRSQVAEQYGGAVQSGIAPSNTTPNIFLYSDPERGEEFGYRDGWASHPPGTFLYGGEGQVGDQSLTGGNRSVLTHGEQGRALRLFFTVPGSQQAGGKLQRYVGAFRLDPEESHSWHEAPDVNKNARKVVVFRLLPAEVVTYPKAPLAQPEVSVGKKAQLAPEKLVKVCPKHHLELLPSGQCSFCE